MLLWEHIAWTKSANKKAGTSPIEERIRDQNLTLNDLHIGPTLGKGQFGRVRLATSKHTGMKYALKQLKKRDVIETNQVRASAAATNIVIGIEIIANRDKARAQAARDVGRRRA
eukprot:1524320-Pyramimonas_sp.AAC.2